MPSKYPKQRFQDISDEINFIMATTEGMNLSTFKADRVVRYAVERSFLIIAEAATKLGEEAFKHAPNLPWGDIRGIGNVIRHEYGAVDHTTMWTIIEDELSDLLVACEKAIANIVAN